MKTAIREMMIQRSVQMPVETRAEPDQEPSQLVGYGAVFYNRNDQGTEFQLFDGVVERLMPSAFEDLGDVRCTFNHDMNQILGRSSAGTLRLSVDEKGLRYEVDINRQDPMAVGVQARVQRGDVDGSSIWFYIEDETRKEEGEQVVYEINKVRLIEVGPVSMPAYQATTAQARSAHEEARRRELQLIESQRQLELDLMDMDLKLINWRLGGL